MDMLIIIKKAGSDVKQILNRIKIRNFARGFCGFLKKISKALPQASLIGVEGQLLFFMFSRT